MVCFRQISALQRDCIVRCLQRETTCLQNLLRIMENTDQLDGRYIKESNQDRGDRDPVPAEIITGTLMIKSF